MADNNNSDENKTETDEKPSESPPNANARTAQTPIIESPTHSSKTKIDVLLKAAGDAPIMKKKKWSVDRNKRVSWISEFIKKYLKFEPTESMFLYVNQSFAPAPDTEVGSVFDCFGSDGKLVLHYCKTQAWG
ncbi:ubiquitin-like protein ATG12 [Mytilus galloprovincialis]|uniref:ubiquitin-like protein ATG12 n=1 Tax=Mytilus galloprovincialis TaxID=29158 RepID=UPI003F7B3DAA